MSTENKSSSLFGFQLNEHSKSHLRSLAQVAGVAAFLSLISSILSLVIVLIGGGTVRTRSTFEGFEQTQITTTQTESLPTTIISFLIGLLLFFFLNRFASQTKKGLAANDMEKVSSGLGGLASYFATLGVLIIIALVAMVGLFFLVLARL